MRTTVYEYDGTAHEIEDRGEWGRECRETVEGENGIDREYWYHDMGDGRYTRDDESLTLYGADSCAYCDAELPWPGINPPAVPAEDDDYAWAELAALHVPSCEWIATRAHTIEA